MQKYTHLIAQAFRRDKLVWFQTTEPYPVVFHPLSLENFTCQLEAEMVPVPILFGCIEAEEMVAEGLLATIKEQAAKYGANWKDFHVEIHRFTDGSFVAAGTRAALKPVLPSKLPSA